MTRCSNWRKQFGFHVLTLVVAVGLAACGQTPVSSGDAGGQNPPPDPGPDPTTGTVTLSWDAPTANVDGSTPLDDLTGYTIVYGSTSDDLSNRKDVGSSTTAQIDLPLGTYYVGVLAYDNWRNESPTSNIIQVTVSVPSAS